MCGLHLIIDYTQSLDSSPIQKMLQASAHRGGDGQAWTQQRFPHYQLFLAHNRLAIQSLGAEAIQPMQDSDKGLSIAYNGELYNHAALANKYQLPTQGQSDTEVLLQAIAAGISPEQWEGMYAFVCHDAKQHLLHIGRDPQGIKPLFFVQNEKYLIVASEISAILASGLVEKKLNKNQIPHYLAYKYAAAPHTFFEGIREVPMRVQCLDLLQKETVSIENFYQKPLPNISALTQPQNLLAHTEALLCEALQQQMQAAVPIGLWLSGGTDSTLLLALLQRLGYTDIPCFAIIHQASDRAHSTQDSQFARKAALRFGGKLQEVVVSENILLRLDEHLRHMEQPIADTATLLTELLAAHTSQSCRVALSGAGADELFGGYRRHQALYSLLKFQKKWNGSILNIKHLQKLSTNYPQVFKHLGSSYRKILQGLHPDSRLTFDTFCRSEVPLLQTLEASFQNQNPPPDPLRAALDFDLFHYLPQDILRLNDAWGMRHGLEVRVPYLHENIRAFAASLPGELLMRHGRKWLLRELLEQYGGKEFARRKKEGFGMAWSHWSRQARWQHLLQPLLAAEQPIYEYIDFERFSQMLRRHLSGKADFGTALWAVLVLHRWLQIHFP
jgi:asparagine synthase (glutamine-hydrolysing)